MTTQSPSSISPEFVQHLTASQSALYAFVVALIGRTDEANDVLQETNMKLCKRADKYDPQQPFLRWAYVFARFEVMAWRKRQQRSRLGTSFSVSLSPDGNTDVAVFDGEVVLYRPNATKAAADKMANLREGEALRVNSRYEMRRLQAISLTDGALAITQGTRKRAVVTRVADNVTEADFHRFYSIHVGAMGPGARPYSTLSKPRWQAVEKMAFPEELIGADVVGTFSADRHDRELNLTLTLAKDATLYVMHDSRAEVPNWLQEGFQKTEHKLQCGPWVKAGGITQQAPKSPDGEGWILFNVWKKDAPAGTVTLGSPHPTKDTRSLAMYGIAAKAKSPSK